MAYSEKELDEIFAKGTVIPGKDASLYRKDACGNTIYRPNYGQETPMGWEVDHSFPKAKGGGEKTSPLSITSDCNSGTEKGNRFSSIA